MPPPLSPAQQKMTGKYCAIKIIRKDIVIKLKQVEHTINEKNILDCIDCPFIIHMIEHFQVWGAHFVRQGVVWMRMLVARAHCLRSY